MYPDTPSSEKASASEGAAEVQRMSRPAWPLLRAPGDDDASEAAKTAITDAAKINERFMKIVESRKRARKGRQIRR